MAAVSARVSALSAALRVARRDAWRNKGRSALIAVMVALPVLLASTLSVLYRSSQFDPQDTVRMTLGSQAQASVQLGDGQPTQQSPSGENFGSPTRSTAKSLTRQQFQDDARALIPARDMIITDTRQSADRLITFQDRLLNVEVREFDYTAPGARGLVARVSGRAPARAGEVVVSQDLARKQGIRIGDRLSYTPSRDVSAKTFAVVGIVGGLPLVGDPSVIGLPGSLLPAQPSDQLVDGAGPAATSLLVTGPDPVTWSQVLALNRLGSTVLSRQVLLNPPPAGQVPKNASVDDSSSKVVGVGIVVVAFGLALLQIALLAGPAIAVGARRNQRSLAIMASAGAERRHLRAVVLATSGLIGLVSSLVAAVVGAGSGALIVVLVRRYADQLIPRVDVHPLDLICFVLIGAGTSVAAALIPARQAARLDVIATLTGRRGQAAPRLRVPVVGLSVSAAGAVLAYLSTGWKLPLLTALGLAMAEIGLVTAAGSVVALAARLAVRFPFAPRFALRDAARQRGRTAPAVAAVLAALAGGTTALVFVAAQSHHDRLNYTPTSQRGAVTMQVDGKASPADFTAAATALRRILPIATLAAYRVPANQGGSKDPASQEVDVEITPPPGNACPLDSLNGVLTAKQLVISQTDPRCNESVAAPDTVNFSNTNLFDDGSALALITGTRDPADQATLRSGRVLVFNPLQLWPDGTVHVTVSRYSQASNAELGHRDVVLPARLATTRPRLDGVVYPLSVAGPLGVTLQPGGLIASTTRMPTSTEQDRATGAVQDIAGFTLGVERGYVDRYRIGLIALVVAAALITLGGTFTAVGLAAAEGRADVATLAAVGASPGVRRRLAASQAGVIVVLGSVLGTLSGILAGWILIRSQQVGEALSGGGHTWHLVLPWSYLFCTAVGVPLLAIGIAFVSTRSRLPMVRRLDQ